MVVAGRAAGGGPAVAAVVDGAAAAVVGAAAAARPRVRGSKATPMITVTTRKAVPSWYSLRGRFPRTGKRKRAVQ